MPKINVLPREISELIAAGEVVERPASAVKEMIENSIDAGARRITIEIKRGGITYIRITDDGCGISPDDVPLAFLRHATSKIKTGTDLDSIATLGFRGEALAAVSSVSKTEMITKTAESESGTHYLIEGGTEIINEEVGCEKGTTIVIRDLFYNTPARMKFLKKDVSEGNAVAAVVERAALSHPETAFRFIREGKTVMTTSGDGELRSAIYTVLGREFSNSLIPVSDKGNAVGVEGYTCKPVYCRQSRAGQFIFLNGRLVHSGTVCAAVEQAYKNSAMVGKFPAFVLNITIPFNTVDVNVHPAKTEVRFSDEKRIFDAVYYAVKTAITTGDTRPVIGIGTKKTAIVPADRMNVEEYRQAAMKLNSQKPQEKKTPAEIIYNTAPHSPEKRFNDINVPFFENKKVIAAKAAADVKTETPKKAEPIVTAQNTAKKPDTIPQENETAAEYNPKKEVRFIGEAFSTYIVVERDKSVFLIDKHAAHERILFNELKKNRKTEVQNLLTPVSVRLGEDEYTAVTENTELLNEAGFEVEDFGNSTVLVRSVPAMIKNMDVASVMSEAADSLISKGNIQIDELDRIFHTVACKAAIKAGYKTTDEELFSLATKVLDDRDVMYCPHGRPVAFEILKKDLEKQFGRIQ